MTPPTMVMLTPTRKEELIRVLARYIRTRLIVFAEAKKAAQ